MSLGKSKNTDEVRSPEVTAESFEEAMAFFRRRRDSAFKDDEFARLRQELTSCKQAAVERLPQLVSQFTKEAERSGAAVHFADTAQKACEIIGDIALRHKARLIAKSQSVLSEEIELAPYLEGMGTEVVATNLGEWLVQLAGRRPAYILFPALGMTQETIAEVLSQVAGKTIPPVADRLVEVARNALRLKLADTDIGVSEADIGIAALGASVVVDNEGDARITSSLPPVHVALMGIDRIVPDLDDAVTILEALNRSRNGQKMAVYTSIITRPSSTGDIAGNVVRGTQGPGEMHVILLDNGRSAMAQDPVFREALRCIYCYACANVCPSFREVREHTFGHLYLGPIGLVLTAFSRGLGDTEPLTLCSECDACQKVCPAGIALPQLIQELRRRIREKRHA